MFKAKRVQSGQYIYRGHDIHRMEDGHWNIKAVGVEFWCDGANTLTDAKATIDRWINYNDESKHLWRPNTY